MQRMRVQRLMACAGVSFRYVAALLAVALVALLVFPFSATGISGVLAVAAGVWLAVLAVAWFRPVDKARTVRGELGSVCINVFISSSFSLGAGHQHSRTIHEFHRQPAASEMKRG